LKDLSSSSAIKIVGEIHQHRPDISVTTDSKTFCSELQAQVPGANAQYAVRKREVQVKKYKSESEFERDAKKLYERGWHIEGQSSRTKKWSATAGFLTNKGQTTVTWLRGGEPDEELAPISGAPTGVAETTQNSIPEQIQQLAQLKDQRVLTEEEFETKKAELLSRM
jgi:hypothetical protein